MRLIKKQSLKEDYTASKDTEQKEMNSADEAYKQAILTAVGSESGAWNEYNTILDMEKDVSQDLVAHFHETIMDIRDEEMKHIGQLTKKASELPDMKAAYEAGQKEAEEGQEQSMEKPAEEAVKESVLTESVVEKIPDATRKFYSGDIYDIILTEFPEVLDNNTNDSLIYKWCNPVEELTAEEVDIILDKIQDLTGISSEQREIIETKLIQAKDPVVKHTKEVDFDNDIGVLRSVLENLHTTSIKDKVSALIESLLEDRDVLTDV